MAFNPALPFEVVEGETGKLYNQQGGIRYDYSPPYAEVSSGPGGNRLVGLERPGVFDLRSPFCSQKPINEVTFADYDGRSFRQIYQVPFTGPCLVRAVYLTDRAFTVSITNTAFAAGRAITDDNPLDADGNAATWTAVSDTVVRAGGGSNTTDGSLGFGKTSWVSLVVPAAVDSGTGGYIYVGTQSNASSRRGLVSTPSIDYQVSISPILTELKYRACGNASGDNVSANQNDFVDVAFGGNAFVRGYHPVAWIDVVPLAADVTFGAFFGDSTEAGYGTTSATAPMGYSPGAIMANMLTKAGRPCTFANFGSTGKTATYYNRRLRDCLLDPGFKPAFVVLQPFTVNSGFTTNAINTGIAEAMESIRQCRAAGIKNVFLRTITPSTSSDANTYAARIAGNAKIRDSGIPYIDSDLILTDPSASPYPTIRPEFTPDNLHYLKAGNEALAAAYKALVEAT